ncbi:MAG: D-aminoacyl-tRNA deacylase [Thermodesulfobacteriota bacterium]
MRAVVQRVKEAGVTVKGVIKERIGAGLLVFVGVEIGDKDSDIDLMADKLLGLRIFEDSEEKMNLSVMDKEGALLIVSQFTLLGDTRKGRRPSFNLAEKPEAALKTFDKLVSKLQESRLEICTGEFQKMMDISLINDGPVTILIDSKKIF